MNNGLYDHGFGITWDHLRIEQRKGYYTSVADFHAHPFYEINLILSGNVKILLKDQVQDGTGSFIVLTKPQTPHFISCKPDVLYSRLYLSFSEEYIADYVPEWEQLRRVFGEKGRILPLSKEQTEFCRQKIEEIRQDGDPFRQRLLILGLLSHLSDLTAQKTSTSNATPAYIADTLSYLNLHYNEKIVANELAQLFFISRTTLMTAFKKYTGTTLGDYLAHLRLKKALLLLRQGNTQQDTAEQCGFCDSSAMIRCFKQHYGITPKQYLLKNDLY